ncbi:hypothetical protein IPH92_00925 [Candidatus Kaiserbacteria bacterium]|nr:MAG: hypothetical protein IPH92_00925 [Candidatus Kaiserbacteria bacterium]
MSVRNLDQDGQQKLKRVIELANGDIAAIPRSVREVLKHVSENGRREYLRGELTRLAKKEINTKKVHVPEVKPATTPRVILSRREWADAWRHETAMVYSMPKRDRS